MNSGLTEAAMRESLIRSQEYAQAHGGPVEPPIDPPPPISPPPDPPGPVEPPKPSSGNRAAFYYPWFPATWSVGGVHVFYHPTKGYYSSDDKSVVDYHIKSMDYGRINVAIASWWGQGEQSEDTRIPLILDRIKALNSPLRMGIYFEKEGFGDPSEAEIRSDLEYLKRYAKRDEFAYRDGKPVLFVFNADDNGCHLAQKWMAAAGDYWHLVLKVFQGWESCPRPTGGWHQYGGSERSMAFDGTVNISPGYWQANEPAPRLVRSVDAFKAAVAASNGARWQLITSFSEWGEGTAIESANEWATPSGFGAYLDVLHAT